MTRHCALLCRIGLTCCSRHGLVVLLAIAVGWTQPARPQGVADSEPLVITEDLAPLMRELLQSIASVSDYEPDRALPPVFQLPQYRIEAKVCDEPCDVRAAYVPREGIYLSGNLDPVHEPLDRGVLVHELVHYLQQGHPKFVGMNPCERERRKEVEAFAIQNAYLARLGRPERAVFYDDFDCGRADSE